MTLPVLVKRLHLTEDPSVADLEREARLRITQAVLDHLDEADASDGAPTELIDGLRAQYQARRRRLEENEDHESRDGPAGPTPEADHSLRQMLVVVQRQSLAELLRQGLISVATLRSIERDLDLEDAGIRGG